MRSKSTRRFGGVSIVLLLLLSAPAWGNTELDPDANNDKLTNVSPNVDEAPVPEQVRSGLQGRPKWAFGIGGAYIDAFDYPGSLDSNRRSAVLPFFIYRSERFRFGGGGVSAVSIERPRLRLDWSIAASLNSSSEGNSARSGMDDLDFLFEFGPQIIVRVVDTNIPKFGDWRVDWSSKIRAVLSTDFGRADDRGLVFETALATRLKNIMGVPRLTLFGFSSVTAGTERLHDYFYEVRPQFVTASRPEFDAKAGLIDIKLGAGLALSLPRRVRVFVSVNTGFYHASANRDSPLHRAIQSTTAAVGIIWTIAESRQRVGILDTD